MKIDMISQGYVFVNPGFTTQLLCRFTHSITPMDMVHEKIFTIAGSKQVKMIVRGYYSHKQTEIQTFVEIWVKQRTEAYFCNPHALKLPMYGKFEKAEHKNIRELVVKESGISDQQFDQVITEFKQITRSSVLF